MKRYKLGAYELTDNETGREYRTGVSLADCTIPFEVLLNRQDNYLKYYREVRSKLQRENRRLSDENTTLNEQLDKISDWLMEEFDINLEEVLSDE